MRIRSRLLVVLALPLIGMCVFAAGSARSDWDAANDAEDLREDADQLALLLDVNRALDDELDQAVGLTETRSFGLDARLVSETLGFDASTTTGPGSTGAILASALRRLERADRDGAEWADPQAVRAILAERDAVLGVRESVLDGSVEPMGAQDVQALVEPLAARAVSAELNHLLLEAPKIGSAPVNEALEIQAASVRLQESNRAETRSLRTLLLPFGSINTARPQQDFIGDARQFDVSLATLEAALPAPLDAELDEIQSSAEWMAYDELRNRALGFTVSTQSRTDYTLERLIFTGSTLYRSSGVRSRDLGDFDDQINEIVADRTEVAQEVARTRFAQTVAILIALIAATLALAGVIVRSIVRPLHRLEELALVIGQGELPDFSSEVVGPSDLASVEHALESLAEGLNIVEMQATALAAGSLDSSVLEWSAPGRLGESLQGSVDKLRQLTASLDHQATHDMLTGLPNRAAIIHFLNRTSTGRIEDRQPVLAIMLDLDGFKQSNDMLGHPIGDELLQHTARRLQERANGGFLGRLGGDEFMVLYEGPLNATPLELARNMIDGLTVPFATTAGTIWLSAGAGLVESDSTGWLSPTEILQRSDMALLQAKAEGQGVIVEFDDSLNDTALERSRIQGELRSAIDNGDLELHFQPIVQAHTGVVSGVEALLRWFDISGVPVPPSVFIPAAEQSDLILRIDNWVISEACRTLASWRGDPTLGKLTMSINISGRHVASTELVDVVRSALDASGAEANKLIIEVTETEVIPNLELAIAVFDDLKDLGVSLAIDDFGTGFASVAHLRRVPFDRLKIDRSFVSQLEDSTDRSIATLLVSLGQSLHLEVVAEGVETEEQRAWSAAAGCTHVQGYFFGSACPIEQLPGVVAALSPRPRVTHR